MEPSFRIAEGVDIDTLIEFMRQFYAIDDYPFDEPIARAALERIIHDRSLGRVWLIDLEGAAIGYVVLTLGYSLEYHGRDAFIDEFFIQPSHRKRGVGSIALQFLERICSELGIQALHLEVERANVAGQALYRKYGFEDHNRYLMTKWLKRKPGTS